jgi:hypothetical protein
MVVAADDDGRDPIAGNLVAANHDRVVPEDRSLGCLQSPRAGLTVAPAPSPAE